MENGKEKCKTSICYKQNRGWVYSALSYSDKPTWEYHHAINNTTANILEFIDIGKILLVVRREELIKQGPTFTWMENPRKLFYINNKQVDFTTDDTIEHDGQIVDVDMFEG